MNYRRISLDELRKSHFAPHDVLTDHLECRQREHDLRSATAFTNTEHDEVGLVIELANGEQVEYVSDMIDLEESLVEVKGGYAIPIKSIVKVEI
ncbi:MAG: hypothetical protein ACK5V5_03330 [Cyclobacteriaceae bacterium]|jgi:hypothetical protein|nr:hypothetical protein [Flammeovirgaceae bacterium]